MAGIILPEKAAQVLLANKFESFNENVSNAMSEVFPVALYSRTAIQDWSDYYDSNKVKVKLGYPNEEITSPTVYVAAGSADHDENSIGFANRYGLSADSVATDKAYIYSKAARIIAAADNYNIALTLAALCEYFIHQEEEWFEEFGMSLPRINYPELEFLSQYWPQKLLYRTFLLTFSTVDLIMVSKDDRIKGIDVEIINM